MGIFPGQNTGVGCHALLQRIFPTQGLNPGLPHCRQVLYHLSFSAAAAKSVQSCPTLCDPIGSSPPGSPCPWDSPGKNTGVGYHCLLQCMKVKSEREVAQSCLTLSNPMDCSLPGSSAHGSFQARVLEWGAVARAAHFSGFSTCCGAEPQSMRASVVMVQGSVIPQHVGSP